MSNLVVVGFPKAQEAEDVRRELVTIQQQHLIALARQRYQLSLADAVAVEETRAGVGSLLRVQGER